MGDGVPDSRYTFVKIPFKQLQDEASNLWVENHQETGFLDETELNVDVEKYLLLEANGYILVIAAMLDNKIIGYAVILSDKLLHNKDVSFVRIDTIFITKKYRSLSLFKKLINYIEECMKSYKINYIFISSSMKRRLDKLLERYDYKPTEVLYSKELK